MHVRVVCRGGCEGEGGVQVRVVCLHSALSTSDFTPYI